MHDFGYVEIAKNRQYHGIHLPRVGFCRGTCQLWEPICAVKLPDAAQRDIGRHMAIPVQQHCQLIPACFCLFPAIADLAYGALLAIERVAMRYAHLIATTWEFSHAAES